MPRTQSTERPSRNDQGHLRTLLRITPHPAAGCPVLESGDRGQEVKQNILSCVDSSEGESTCKAEVTVDGGSGAQLLEARVKELCICPVFREHDCVVSIDGFEGEELIVSLSIPDRDELVAIISSLRDREATVRLQRVVSTVQESPSRALELDTDSITSKQREAVRAAIEAGYYETPREADLSDLSDELDVSRSAVSQRLTAVESKLVAELFRAENGSRVPTE